MGIYIISIGGTGSRCVEAIIHLAATGLFSEEPIRVLFIDPDKSNGNLERTKESLKVYEKCYIRVAKDIGKFSWMKTQIESSEWAPLNDSINKNLGSFFKYENYKQNNPALGHLFDVLYTKEEREANLDVGFRGRPAIGAAIMSQVNLDETNHETWSKLIQDIKQDIGASGKYPKIFLCGSIFGGTGASGFPTIGKLIRNKLKSITDGEQVKIGGLLMLPYFQFAVPPEKAQDEKVYARPEQFLLNTEAALNYYVTQAKEKFDTVYLIGDQDLASVKQFSVGKNNQKNEPHFVELYAALAARHFLLSPSTPPVVLISRNDPRCITWKDLPESNEVKRELVNATRFAFAWITGIDPELTIAREMGVKNFQTKAPWFIKYFRPAQGFLGKILTGEQTNLPDFNEQEQQDAIKNITQWCETYLRWLGSLHYSVDNVELFKRSAFTDPNGQLKKELDNFPELVIDGNIGTKQQQDTIQRLKEKLDEKKTDNKGAIGLAKDLYLLCKI